MPNNHYRGLAHIGVYTSNVEESLEFYNKLGAKFIIEGDLQKPEGPTKCILLDLGGITIELINPTGKIPTEEGTVAHIAILVDDVDKAAEAIKSKGINTFRTPEKQVSPSLLGGLENWFFTGPSGEILELIKMYSV